MSDYLLLFSFSLLLAGVFGADVEVSVMEGDNVMLTINLDEIKDVEKLRWTFEDNDSVTIEKTVKNIDKIQYNGVRFKDRLNVNNQTGSLTIPNIKTKDTGVYKLEVKTSNDKTFKLFKTFNVILNVITVSVMKGDSFTLPTGDQKQPVDVKWKFKGTALTNSTITNIKPEQFGEYKAEINCTDFILHRTINVTLNDEVESVSELKGETLTLHTNTTQPDDVIVWTFKDAPIAELNKKNHSYTNHVNYVRLDSHGSLIIMKLKTIDSGLYDVNIKSSNSFIHKRFRVTVTESSSRSHQDKIGPGLFVLVIMLVIVLV